MSTNITAKSIDEIVAQSVLEIGSASWTLELEATLLNVLLRYKAQHGVFTGGGSPKGVGWKVVVNCFNEASRLNYKHQQLESKVSSMKRDYTDWCWLTQTSGFGLDPETNLPTADDVSWTALGHCPSHKGKMKFRHRQLDHQSLLESLFTGNVATGKYANVATPKRSTSTSSTSSLKVTQLIPGNSEDESKMRNCQTSETT